METYPSTIIFDLDGTLYEDERVYDRYAQEMAAFLAPPQSGAFLAAWEEAKGGGVRSQTGSCASDGPAKSRAGPRSEAEQCPAARRLLGLDHTPGSRHKSGTYLSIGTEYRGKDGTFQIGDWWGLLAALGDHFGVGAEGRERAFIATRSFLVGRDFELLTEPGLRDTLRHLHRGGAQLIAMSNSPLGSVEEVLERLGIRDCFDTVVPSAGKPAGLQDFLAERDDAERTLSVGDHYVNDVEPALRAGARALYIDRHGTGLGADRPRCTRVPSIEAALRWLRENCARAGSLDL